MMILVKLGGSVITDKGSYRTFREEAMTRLAGEMSRAHQDIVLVHGAGSFGHVLAKKHRLQEGFHSPAQISGMAKVMLDVRDLNLQVMKALDLAGLPAASIPPSACVTLENGELARIDLETFSNYLELGIMPVTFGDVALDSERRFGICSGDQLMLVLAKRLRPERIIFCADVDGVFTADPNQDPQARLIENVERKTLGSLPRTARHDDVTGSIYGKIERMLAMAAYSRTTMVINGTAPGRLEGALSGERVIGSYVSGGGA